MDGDPARVLASIVAGGAASTDVASLSATEAAAVYAVLDEVMDALWCVHRRTLFPLFMAVLTRRGLAGEPDEPDDDEGNQVH